MGANIVINNTLLGTATDINGQYALVRVPSGVYILRIEYIGSLVSR